ncbi:hypothetical protein CRG98_019168 [Punica granatum]|uniref:DUF7745 domain-containing protein n=1 Tax=Punica granatum TaxID=22663 RepID=A0A2I0JVU2_PUNGR|nr:hypothetical protein CRG98_019168 [Punica granatum]
MISGDSFSVVSVARPHGKVDTPKPRDPKASPYSLATPLGTYLVGSGSIPFALLACLRGEKIRCELQYGWEHGIRTEWLIDFIHIRALCATRESYQCDASHGFILLIFGTILFPHASDLIDGALGQVVLQVVGGHSYVEAVLAETVQSLDYVREVRRGRMRGSPHLLQIWLLTHIKPFGLSHPFSYITDESSLITRLLHVFQPFERNYTDWRQFMEDLTPTQFLWVTRWNPSGPMAIGCPSVVESSYNSAAYRIFPPKRTALLTGSCGQTLQLCSQRGFYESEKLDAYRPRTASTPRAPPVSIPNAENSAQAAARTELQSIREERDRLQCKLVDTRVELAEHRELQRELTHAQAHIANQDLEIAPTMSCTTGESCQPSRIDHPRSAPLHGETCCDQRPFIPTTHPTRQASHANLRGQATCSLHPSSMARFGPSRVKTSNPGFKAFQVGLSYQKPSNTSPHNPRVSRSQEIQEKPVGLTTGKNRVDPRLFSENDYHSHLRGSIRSREPLTLPQNAIGRHRGDVRPDWWQTGPKFHTCSVFRDLCRSIRVDSITLGENDHHSHLEGSLGYPYPLTLPQNSIRSFRGDVRPDLYQSGLCKAKTAQTRLNKGPT